MRGKGKVWVRARPSAGSYTTHGPCPLSWFLKRFILFLRIYFDYFKCMCVCLGEGLHVSQEATRALYPQGAGEREVLCVCVRHSKVLGSGLSPPGRQQQQQQALALSTRLAAGWARTPAWGSRVSPR